jgi:hypothetical protein
MSGFKQLVSASLARWGLAPTPVLLLNAVAIAGIPVLSALFFVDREIFGFLLDEDRVVEWGQVFLWLLSGIVGAVIAIHRFRRGYRGQGLLWIGFALATVVIVGEEISWGQRLLGLETPEILEEINRQEELNLHNIGNTLTAFNLVLFFASLYAIAAEWIQRRWNIAGRWADGDRLYVPPFFLAGLFGVMLLYRAVRSGVLNQESYALTSLSEWAELCFAAALLVTLLLSARWVLRRGRDARQDAA